MTTANGILDASAVKDIITAGALADINGVRAGLGMPSIYLGQVSTHCFQPTNVAAANKQNNSYKWAFAREDIVNPVFRFDAWRTTARVEVNAGAPVLVNFGVFVPSTGQIVAATFGGAAQGSVSDGGTLMSDPVPITIKKGTKFRMQTFSQCTAGNLYNDGVTLRAGEGATQAASGASDGSMSTAALPGGSSGGYYGPSACLAYTDKPSVAFLGDSLIQGHDSQDNNGWYFSGIAARCLGPSFAYIDVGSGGDEAKTAKTMAKRTSLINHCSHIFCNLGINDMALAGSNAATLLADKIALYALFPNHKIFGSTLTPYGNSSTDNFASPSISNPSVNNQTKGTTDAQRVIYNNSYARAGAVTGELGIFDIADFVETSRDSGYYRNSPDGTGIVNWATDDGSHYRTTLARLAEQTRLINPSAFTR